MKTEKVSSSHILKLAKSYQNIPGTVLLYSGGPQDAAKHSFLCTRPSQVLKIYPQKWILQTQEGLREGTHSNPWETLKEKISLSFEEGYDNIPEWTGYLSYEMGAFADFDYPLSYYSPTIPLAEFYKPEAVYTADVDHTPLPPPIQFFHHSNCQEYYIKLIHKIQNEIKNGDVYQVNLSHEIKWPYKKNAYLFFLNLTSLNPSAFSAYLVSHDFSIISSSPERLLQKRGQVLETCPIKGTVSRGKTVNEDELAAKSLLHSEKDRAELLMITDLMRNDLGKISLPGSVNVESLARLETYPNVFHLVSTIRSLVKPESNPIDIIRAVFPGGSITGCPKLSAMKSIYRHEKRARGIYTGSIGYITSTGNFDFNIAIRTLLYQNQTLFCSLGGAIVADSIPENEYKETLAKGASIFYALEKSC